MRNLKSMWLKPSVDMVSSFTVADTIERLAAWHRPHNPFS